MRTKAEMGQQEELASSSVALIQPAPNHCPPNRGGAHVCDGVGHVSSCGRRWSVPMGA